MPVITRRHIHEVNQSGALFFLLNGFNGALNRLADQVGGGLRAIALALSTPQDNSTEVQQQLDKLEQHLKAERERLQTVMNNQLKGD